MIGRRLPDSDTGEGVVFGPSDYGRIAGVWHARAPKGHLGCLSGHTVTEHEDGTITVSPSILIDDGHTKWHGYLERGVWREC